MDDVNINLSSAALARQSGALLDKMRAQKPLVQNITNLVAMDISANVLLAMGASPAMVHAPEEVEEFADLADALVVNTGTLSAPFASSMILAAKAMRARKKPWVLDPVGAGITRYRDAHIAQLLQLGPSTIRGNASEILNVARLAGLSAKATPSKGVDSLHSTMEAQAIATALAQHLGCVVAVTGAQDVITNGVHMVRLANGDGMMTRVTALGCALSAVCAAFSAVTPDSFAAAVAAIAVYGVAGEMAEAKSKRPGSFRTAFLDILLDISTADLTHRLKVLP